MPFCTRMRLPAVQRSPLLEKIMNTAASSARSKDRKSTRLNSSHGYISYAVFCLKKKKQQTVLKSAIERKQFVVGLQKFGRPERDLVHAVRYIRRSSALAG